MEDNRQPSECKPTRVKPQTVAERAAGNDARSRSGASAPNRPRREHSALERAIAGLNMLSREELVQSWVRTYHHSPPKGISRRLLELSAAYALQAKAFGGLKPSLRNALRAALDPSGRRFEAECSGHFTQTGHAAHSGLERPNSPCRRDRRRF